MKSLESTQLDPERQCAQCGSALWVTHVNHYISNRRDRPYKRSLKQLRCPEGCLYPVDEVVRP
jgi:hypothetical protein